MSKQGNIFLSRRHLEYLVKMLETPDPHEAVEKFALIMAEEKADPSKMEEYINKMIKKQNDGQE